MHFFFLFSIGEAALIERVPTLSVLRIDINYIIFPRKFSYLVFQLEKKTSLYIAWTSFRNEEE